METSLAVVKTENEKFVVEYWKNEKIRQTIFNNRLLIATSDLEKVTGVSPDTFLQRARRHPDEYDLHVQFLQLKELDSGKQINKPVCFIDAVGANKLIDDTQINNLRDPEIKERFKKWREEKNLVIEQFKHNQLVNQQPTQNSIKLKIEFHLQAAETIATELGISLPQARMIALDQAGKELNLDLHRYKILIPGGMEHFDPAYLTPTQIAIRISKPHGRQFTSWNVNKYLQNHGYQVKDSFTDRWAPTDKGRRHSKEIAVVTRTWSGDQLLWHEDIIRDSLIG